MARSLPRKELKYIKQCVQFGNKSNLSVHVYKLTLTADYSTLLLPAGAQLRAPAMLLLGLRLVILNCPARQFSPVVQTCFSQHVAHVALNRSLRHL